MKQRRIFIILTTLIPVCVVLAILAIWLSRSGNFSIQLPVEHKPQFSADTTLYPSRLHVEGNHLVNERGETVRVRGLMPADPYKLSRDGNLTQEFIEEMRTFGANAIRIPVHPEFYSRDADYLWRYLDPIVTWAGEAGLYVIIDWHYIGNVVTGAGPMMPDIDEKPQELTMAFWTQTAGYFKDTPHVMFEIFNEPQAISADLWRENANQIVRVIRDQGAEQVILVGGTNYGKDLSWVLKEPVSGVDIAYASHIYPSHKPSTWDSSFGDVAGVVPVIMTEWGFMDQAQTAESKYLVGTVEGYGEPFLQYLDERQTGWIACWYDDEWMPPLFTEDFKSLTSYGLWLSEQFDR